MLYFDNGLWRNYQLLASSSAVTITKDSTSHSVSIGINQGSLNLASIGGTLTSSQLPSISAASISDLSSTIQTEVFSAKKYGFKADYTGSPQYDGQDSTRVTCTDNTQAFSDMLDDCIAKKVLRVYFPTGHYGIKLGNIQKDLTGCTLIIVGDGMDQSIIDFVKENSSNSVYVNETKAEYIAKITNADKMIFQDIWIKATTNYNNVNGNQQDLDAVYYGAVWGFVFDKFSLLKMERVRVSHFNYRGISTKTTGSAAYAQLSEKVFCIDCDFQTNKSTGLWINDVKEVEIVGGEYHHNGQRGTTGTGYGVACSSRVGQLIIRGGARFHHNYRKGFDTHGCINVTVDGAICEDNVLYHFAILGWAIITLRGSVSINNLVMSNGYTAESKAWLDDAYTAIQPLNTDQKIGMLFTVDERVNGSPTTTPIDRVKFNNVKVLCHYNGADKNPNVTRYAAGTIFGASAETSFVDCDFDLTYTKVSTNSVYGACLFERLCSKYSDRNFKIYMPEVKTYGVGKFGAVYISGTPTSIEMDNVNFKLAKGYIFGATNAGEIANTGIGDAVKRKITNCTLEWEEFPPVTVSDNKILGSISYLSNTNLMFFNNTARIGTTKYILPSQGVTDFEKVIYNYTGLSIPANTPFMDIILDKVTYATFEILLNCPDGTTEKVIVNTRGVNLDTTTIAQDGIKFTVPSITQFTDTDGVLRAKITLSTKSTALPAGMFYGYVKGFSYMYSWGVNRVVGLV